MDLWALSWLPLNPPSMNTSIRERGKSGFNQSKLLVCLLYFEYSSINSGTNPILHDDLLTSCTKILHLGFCYLALGDGLGLPWQCSELVSV